MSSFPDRMIPRVCFLMIAAGLLWLVSCHQLRAQQIRIRRFTTENGLSSNFCYSAVEDKKGFIWVGTRDGLNKFDGRSFRTYYYRPYEKGGLPSNVIRDLAVDSTGRVWIATFGGLATIDPVTERFTVYRHSDSDRGSIHFDRVRTILVDSRGRIWLGYEDRWVDYFDPASGRAQHYPWVSSLEDATLPDHETVRLAEAPNGNILSLGLRRDEELSVRTGTWSRVSCKDRNGSPLNDMRLVLTDNGRWFSWLSDSSYRYVAPNAWIVGNQFLPSHVDLPLGGMRKLMIFGAQALLLADADGRVLGCDTVTGRTEQVQFWEGTKLLRSLGRVYEWIRTRDGRILVSTEDGLEILDARESKFRTTVISEATRGSIRSLVVLPDSSILAGSGNYAKLYRSTNSSPFGWSQLELTPKDSTPWSINQMSAIGSRDVIASTTAGGMEVITLLGEHAHVLRSRTHSRGASHCHLLCADSSVWVGYSDAKMHHDASILTHYDRTGKILQASDYPLRDGSNTQRAIWTIVVGAPGILWCGTPHGLFRYDILLDRWTPFWNDQQNPNSIGSNDVWVVLPADAHHLWVGTWGAGLEYFDIETGKCQHFSVNQGLPSNMVMSIMRDQDSDLWISTSRGIALLRNKDRTITSYGVKDGVNIASFEPHCQAITAFGEFLFGGEQGIVAFRPEEVKHSGMPHYPLRITEFDVLGRRRYGELDEAATIQLPYDSSSITVNVSLLEFGDPGSHRYEHRLEGFDHDWISTGSNGIVSYSSLPPGTYVFRSRAAGIETFPEEVRITIVVTPPIWRTWWFTLASALIVLLGVIYAVRRKTAADKRARVEIERAKDQERLQIGGELHDGPLQDLYASRFLLEGEDTSDGLSRENAVTLSTLLRKVRSDLRSITGEMQIPRFDLGLPEEIRLALSILAERHPDLNIDLQVEDPEHLSLSNEQMEALFRIFRTAAGNIVKHSEATHIHISYITTAEGATLFIQDNGKGFNFGGDLRALAATGHYGLLLMKSYADAIGAHLDLRSSPGNGTEIIVRLGAPKRYIWRHFRPH